MRQLGAADPHCEKYSSQNLDQKYYQGTYAPGSTGIAIWDVRESEITNRATVFEKMYANILRAARVVYKQYSLQATIN